MRRRDSSRLLTKSELGLFCEGDTPLSLILALVAGIQ